MASRLSALSRPATRWPGTVLVLLLLLTGVGGFAASSLVMETDLAEFGRDDSAIVQGRDRVVDEFDRSNAAVQVIVDAGEDGNVFADVGLTRMGEVESIVRDELGEDLRVDAEGAPRLRSLAGPINAELDRSSQLGDDIGDAEVAAAASRVLGRNPELTTLISTDAEPQAGTAQAVTLLAELEPELDTQERLEAADRLREQLGIDDDGFQSGFSGLEVIISSLELTNDALQAETQREAPILLALAMLAVVLVLLWLLRSVFDVFVSLLGIVATVIWTFAIIALLGPEHLDLVGPVSQVGVVVPVLVVGLGVDYAVHLSTRYREQRAVGQRPEEAASTAMRTVGGALALATVATAVGFVVTGLAPLEVIADFGIFTAIGVVCAFVVMGLAVPASRVLRDRRRDQLVRVPRGLDLRRVLASVAQLATARPLVPLVLGLLIVGGSLWAASDLETRFDRDDFVPEESEIGAVLALQDELFDGELTETTYVLIDGDATDPEQLDAMRDAHDALADVDHVRSDVDGRPQAISLVTLIDEALADAEAVPEDPSQQLDRLREGRGHEELARFVRDDERALVVELRTNGGDAAAERLAVEVAEAFAPVEQAGADIIVTSDALIIAEMADELRDFQLRSIVTTLAAVVVLLTAYYAIARRRPMLGVISMVPSVMGAALLLGTMGLLDISFDAMTATLTAIAVGIGVPYGVHVTNRFDEEMEHGDGPIDAAHRTLATTGGALAGSALTTFGAFVVLSFSGLALIAQMGLLGAIGIAFALAGAVLIQPAALVVWGRRRHRRRATPSAASWDARRRDPSGAPQPPSPVGAVAKASPAAAAVSEEVPAAAAVSEESPTARTPGVVDEVQEPMVVSVDDPQLASCRVAIDRHRGAATVRSVELRPHPDRPERHAELGRLPLDRIIGLALAAAELEVPTRADP